MTEPAAVVLYEERDGVAFITLNRPEKKNTLTEAVIAGIADGVDRATASPKARAVVLRGAGGVLCAGYDLTGDPGGTWQSPDRPDLQLSGWTSPYDAPGPQPRSGAMGPGAGLAVHGPQHVAVHEDLGGPEAGHRPGN